MKFRSSLSPRLWWHSARYAWTGIRYTYQTQANFRIEVWMALGATLLTAWLHVPPATIWLCCALVLGAELVNTAVEAIVDLASPEIHPLAKIAKDTAAGAVLISSMVALLVGLAVLGPPLIHRFLSAFPIYLH